MAPAVVVALILTLGLKLRPARPGSIATRLSVLVAGGVVLVHPTCGPTQDDDISGEVRFQTYERLAEEVDNPRIRWAYLPYSMHMAGPREALQHMIIRKNYGCTHFIIGRDMAGCKSSLTGDDFYGPYQAQDFARDNAPELGMETVPSLNLVYTEEEGYVTAEHAEARHFPRRHGRRPPSELRFLPAR